MAKLGNKQVSENCCILKSSLSKYVPPLDICTCIKLLSISRLNSFKREGQALAKPVIRVISPVSFVIDDPNCCQGHP